jgi:hypothetical protein
VALGLGLVIHTHGDRAMGETWARLLAAGVGEWASGGGLFLLWSGPVIRPSYYWVVLRLAERALTGSKRC